MPRPGPGEGHPPHRPRPPRRPYSLLRAYQIRGAAPEEADAARHRKRPGEPEQPVRSRSAPSGSRDPPAGSGPRSPGVRGYPRGFWPHNILPVARVAQPRWPMPQMVAAGLSWALRTPGAAHPSAGRRPREAVPWIQLTGSGGPCGVAGGQGRRSARGEGLTGETPPRTPR